jgi:hypothetical protein
MPTDTTLLPSAATMYGTFTARCGFCGWTCTFRAIQNYARMGELLPRGEDPKADKCRNCQRADVRVISVPEPPPPAPPEGFWKVPET